MNVRDIMPILLLVLFSSALSIGSVIVVLVIRRGGRKMGESDESNPASTINDFSYLKRPACWLVVKSRNVLAVQSALGLRNARPCTWMEGFSSDEKLFISPPIKGWIVVTGSGLPDPSDDVDACFRFVREISLKLGQVQLFSASRIVHHHAWVRADGGRVERAYAWAGKTIWDQGCRTSAEQELDLKCFEYAENAVRGLPSQPDSIAANVDKVPLLAARWSLDPARIEEKVLNHEQGVAGKLSRRF